MCKPPNPRPRKLTDAMLRQAAGKIIEEFVRDKTLPADQSDEAIDDLLSVTCYDRHMDGYQIARDLDRYHHWDCTRDMVDIFDMFSTHCSELLEEAEKQWAAENPMEPPFPIGTTVKTPHGVGPIEEVYAHGPARYVVGIEGRHVILMFEDCSAP